MTRQHFEGILPKGPLRIAGSALLAGYHRFVETYLYLSKPSDAYMTANYAITGSDNGLSPVWHQVIILTNDGLLSIIGPSDSSICEIGTKIQFSYQKK